MHRRTLLLGTGAAAGTASLVRPLARPAIAQPAAARTIRYVPQADLANGDPVWTTATVAYIHAALIWDTLYALDAEYLPRPQMVAGHELSDDKLTWTFTLREGLLFHDGEKVLARDCVASIQRWSKRRPYGQILAARLEEMRAVSDDKFTLRLKRPLALMPRALSDYCFVMPERIAATDAFTQIGEYVGSGPFRFLRNEWVPGVGAAYERFDRYVPRDEPPSLYTGGKVARVDRVQWTTMPDPATAAAALGNGEVDWVEQPLIDLLPTLRRNRSVRVLQNDRVGVMGMLVVNHVVPPFSNPKLLRALLPAIDQPAFMEAIYSNEPELFRTGIGVFADGLPMASRTGLEPLLGPRDLTLAKRLVAESGYAGERVVLMSPSDNANLQAMAQVARDVLQQVGLNVDYVSMDWGTLVQRRTSKEPAERGGWSAFCTTYAGLSVADPAGHPPLRGNGPAGYFGWPTDPEMERLRDAWIDAPDLAEQKRIAGEMQTLAMRNVPFVPLGQMFQPTATTDKLADVVRSPTPVFWGVRKVA